MYACMYGLSSFLQMVVLTQLIYKYGSRGLQPDMEKGDYVCSIK